MAITRLGGANAITGVIPTSVGGTGSTAATLPASLINDTSISNITALPAAISTGKVLQVVTATDTSERSTTSTSFVTGSNTLSVNITPASASNKVFIQVCSAGLNNTDGATSHYTIYRDGTDLGNSTEGITALRCVSGVGDARFPMSMSTLDSPSSTSSITYQVYFRAGSNQATLNTYGCEASITAFEIEG